MVRSARLVMLAAAALLGGAPAASHGTAEGDSLAVRRAVAWREWWHADRAPRRWTAALDVVSDAVTWRRAEPGLDVGELHLAGSGEAWRTRLLVVRLDPRAYTLRLAANVQEGALRPWTIALADSTSSLALNAGQFTDAGPWGWVVHRSRERQPPGTGPLSMAVAIDTLGGVHFASAAEIPALRARGDIAEALQSYPALLTGDGELPAPLLPGGSGLDTGHRDARLAIGELRDGRVLIALTRFEALGGALSQLPFGPTVPEMAAIMGALGCRRAVMLDGGLSSQLMVRSASGAERWAGLRAVPLGIVAERKH